jgi:hypothetical protein
LQAAVVIGKLRDARAVPALVDALGDQNETVRGLAAQVLGEIGDGDAIGPLTRASRDTSPFVRDKASAALVRLRSPAPAPSAPGALHVEVGGIGMKAHVSPELIARLREYIVRELERTPGVTLEGKPLSGFLIDSAITALSRKTTDQWVEISCEISFVVGRLPSKAIVVMTSGGATVQSPKLGFRPELERALQLDALQGAVKGAHENLLAFLKTQTPGRPAH